MEKAFCAMTNSLLLITISGITMLLGFFLGKLLTGLKSKANLSRIEERNNQLSLQIDDLKSQLASIIKENKEEISELKASWNLQLDKTEKEREEIRREKDFLSTELTRRNSEFENLQVKNKEQKAEVEKLQERFSKEFEILANKILEQKSEKFTSLNQENIQNILKPLQEKIRTFEEKVDKNSTDFIERHAQLGKQLQFLNEQNLKISEEATNLTKALKGDTKMQGNWGEMVLERVLERSGLQKDSEYFVQQNFYTDNGKRLMPDVIIHLPGEKKMIIDSKVSLNAYERYINEEEETHRPTHLKNHLISVKKRIEELSAKNYHHLYQLESPDFVLLFIPIEAAFAIASNQNPNLYTEAFEKNIIIVTPTTLLAVLKTIDSMWQNEKQKQNAMEIATKAGALYDGFVNLTREMEKVGRQLGTVQNTYEGAMKKLTGKGNLIKKVEYLRTLGAKTSKQLDSKFVEQEEKENDETQNHNLN
ncbi:DNA recombination protein RmuC [Salegentibacter sp. F14]